MPGILRVKGFRFWFYQANRNRRLIPRWHSHLRIFASERVVSGSFRACGSMATIQSQWNS